MAKAIVIVLIIGLGLSVAIAYAGVEPFATYKDLVSNKITTFISKNNTDIVESQRTELKTQLQTILGELNTAEEIELRKRDLPITKPNDELLTLISTSRTKLESLLVEIDTAGAKSLSVIARQVKEIETSYKEYKATYPSNIKFEGTYRTLAPWLGIEQTLSFKGNTLITEDILTGTNVFKYSATMESETKGFIEFTNVASGETSIQLFTYNKEADCIILHTTTRDSGGLTYCR